MNTTTNQNLAHTVERAGRLLHDIILVYCERTYLFKIKEVEKTDTGLTLSTGPAEMGRFYPIPRNLFGSESDIQMALTANRCTEALGCFADLLQEMLKGSGCAVSEVVVVLKEPVMQATFRDQFGFCPEVTYHNIFKVTSPDGDRRWALDPTGLQFGIDAPVMGYQPYLRFYTTEIEGEYKFGTCKRAMEHWNTSPLGLEHVKPAYSAIEQWEEGTGLELPGLLRDEGFIFEEGRDTLLELIKYELDAAMEKADYTAEFAVE